MMLWERFKSCNCVQLPKVGGSFRMLLWVGKGRGVLDRLKFQAMHCDLSFQYLYV